MKFNMTLRKNTQYNVHNYYVNTQKTYQEVYIKKLNVHFLLLMIMIQEVWEDKVCIFHIDYISAYI